MRPTIPPWIDYKLITPILVATAVVVGLGWLTIWLLRRTGLSKRSRDMGQVTPLATWLALIGLVLALAMVLPFWSSLLALGLLAPPGAWLAVYFALVVAANRLLRDRVFHRAAGLANRGDFDGAMAVLRPAVARVLAADPADPGVATGPADPWAPPRGAIRRDARLAGRVNLMGALHALEGDWPTALEWFRRAEAVGGPTPIFRSNIGRARARLGATDEGFAAMREAQADAVGSPPLVRYQMATSFALGLAEAGHHAEARARLDEAIAALREIRVLLPSTRRQMEANFAKVRALLPSPEPAPGEPGLDAGGDRG